MDEHASHHAAPGQKAEAASSHVADHGQHHGEGAGGHHGHEGVGKYLAVFAALCVLTTLSFMTYFPFWRTHFPPSVGWSFMLAVAVCKAMLVILFFMHVKYEANWKYVLTIPAALMSVFLVLMLVPNIGMRGRMASDDVKRREGYMEEALPAGHEEAAPHH